MTRQMVRAWMWVGAAALAACGCHSGEPVADRPWATEPKSYTPRADSSNAFDAYALAALDAEAKGGDSIARVSFSPGQKKEAAAAIKGAVSQVLAASRKPCDFQFVAHKPFQAVPYQRGWRLISRVIVWSVEDACATGDYDRAIGTLESGTRFGFGLTGGGALDASLGLSTVDDLRRAIAPYLSKMSPVQLDKLGKAVKGALESKPPIANAIRNEKENTMLMVQYLQDSILAGRSKEVLANLGPDANEPVQYLEGVADNTAKRHAFFDGLVKAAEEDSTNVEHDAEIAASARVIDKKKVEEPWRKLAKHVFGSARPLLDINDATLARTRLLVLYAETMRYGKEHKAYPAGLDGFTKDLVIDPYSGSPFIYHADPAEFSIYSVGRNGQDDGGDTDASFTKPDLRLEIPNL